MKRRGFQRNRAFHHFARRVKERLGENVSSTMLWQMIIEDINHPSGPQRLTFCARINKRGRRLWMSKIDGQPFWIIFDHRTNMPITILKVDDELTHCSRRDGTGQSIDLRTYLNA